VKDPVSTLLIAESLDKSRMLVLPVTLTEEKSKEGRAPSSPSPPCSSA
jgi:hypothetical protein